MNYVKKIAIFSMMGCLIGMASTPAMADEGEALLAGKSCVACHNKDKKIVGPSFKDIATKYKGNAEASEKLIAGVRNGGAGNWGPIPMPPNPAAVVSDDDLKKIIAWILSL